MKNNSKCKIQNAKLVRIDAQGLYYRYLNEAVRRAVKGGADEIILDRVNGQRYIGAGLSADVRITINGTPGNDLACFMDGPTIIVHANGQDGIGNTLNSGKVIVHGSAGDIAGHSMRGGKIYIKGSAGYRVGIHMKSYQDLIPVLIIGEEAADFLGEYMAGGLIVVLGLKQKEDQPLTGKYLGTGMHGGKMFIRGEVKAYQLGKEVNISEPDKDDRAEFYPYLQEYCREFYLDFAKLAKGKFTKLIPTTVRPYGKLYAY